MIKRTIIISGEAERDIGDIGDWMAQFSPRLAAKFTDDIGIEFASLREMPDRFAKVRRHENLRRKVFGNFLIFYRVTDAAVEIVHILHGAMDYERILFPQEGGGN